MLARLVSFALLVTSAVSAADEQSPAQAPPDRPEAKTSFFPIIGYNTTYRFFAGGGAFLERNEYSRYGLYAVISQDAVGMLTLISDRKFTPRLRWETRTDLGKGFEPYFGEGPESRADQRFDIRFAKIILSTRLTWSWDFFRFGPLIEIKKLRRQTPLEESPAFADFPLREDSVGLGIFQEVDRRDHEMNPTSGWAQFLVFRHVPAAFQTTPARLDQAAPESYSNLETSVRLYRPLFTPRWVAAFNFAGGTSWGSPGYLNQFQLGGGSRLRGYLVNRFRGSHYVVQQNELRFPIWRALGGAAFAEWGQATNDRLGPFSFSKGVGLRLGLPPDQVMQVRVDLAWGKDQNAVALDFGHPF